MGSARVQAQLLMVALALCVMQLPALTMTLPGMMMSDSPASIDVGAVSGHQPVAEPCCAFQAAPTAAVLLTGLALAFAVISPLAARFSRPPTPGLRLKHSWSPGLRGRPLLHAYLN